MLTYKNLYCALVRSMSEGPLTYTTKAKASLPARCLKKPCWTQKTKSSPTTSSPTNQLTAIWQETKKRGERSNAAPAGSLPPCCRHTRLTIVRRGCNR